VEGASDQVVVVVVVVAAAATTTAAVFFVVAVVVVVVVVVVVAYNGSFVWVLFSLSGHGKVSSELGGICVERESS